MNLLEVKIWDRLVGVIVWNETSSSTSFEYSKEFIKSEIELSPLINPLSTKIIKSKADSIYTNTESLDIDTSKGLPLFISDSLPDKFRTELFAKSVVHDLFAKPTQNASPPL